jgi:hypothetical protein
MLAVISLVFILAETLPMVSFIITVTLSVFVIFGMVYEIIRFMDDKKEPGEKNDLID